MDLDGRFESARPRLLSLAHRLTGSAHDAEDVVQTAWTRLPHAGDVENLDGWLTTVTSRLCLDLLRRRSRLAEAPLRDVALASPTFASRTLAADEEVVRREEVSRALMVVLDELTPRQRVAFVLHDLFAVPFDTVASVLGTTPPAAKKLASRARARLTGPSSPQPTATGRHVAVVEAFLAAASGGDLDRLVSLLAPDVVRTADPHLLRPGAAEVVHGARRVAEDTRLFRDRIVAAEVTLLTSGVGLLVAPGGHAVAVVEITSGPSGITAVSVQRPRPGWVRVTLPGRPAQSA